MLLHEMGGGGEKKVGKVDVKRLVFLWRLVSYQEGVFMCCVTRK